MGNNEYDDYKIAITLLSSAVDTVAFHFNFSHDKVHFFGGEDEKGYFHMLVIIGLEWASCNGGNEGIIIIKIN